MEISNFSVLWVADFSTRMFLTLGEHVDNFDEGLEHMKEGLIKLAKKCGEIDECRQTVHSVLDKMMDDDEGIIFM